MTEAYPLQWPAGWPRSEYSQSARFHTGFADARDGIIEELRLMGTGSWNVVISTNIPTRRDGLPYAGQKEPEDRGVAVYFWKDDRQLCIPCDKWNRVQDNLQAIRKTIEALRGLDRWGAKSMVDAAFSGFEALPPPGQPWRSVLGLAAHDTLDDAERAYRAAVKEHHPDRGGDPAKFSQCADAIRQAREELAQ